MTSIEANPGLQEKINNKHSELATDVSSARECAVDSLALLIKLRSGLVSELGNPERQNREVVQQIIQELDGDISLYRQTIGHIVDAEHFVVVFSPRQAEQQS